MDNSAYLVSINSFDPERKVVGIKRIREVTGFGLAQAKTLIENCPSEILNGMHLRQAKELSILLEEEGMTAEIQINNEHSPEIRNLDQIDFTDYENY